jgi:hypothetical protein
MAGKSDPQLPVITNNYWYGGNTIDPKLGTPNSIYYSECLDFRSIPSQISVLPAPQTLSSNLYGLITAMDQDLNGVRYGVDTLGWIYSISTTDVITPLFKMNSAGSSGILYNAITDTLYVPDQKSISLYGKLTSSNSTPVWRPSQFGVAASQAPGTVNLFNPNDGLFDLDQRNDSQGITTGITVSMAQSGAVTTNTTATTPVPKNIAENTTGLCFFNPDIEPGHSIWPYIVAKGTGNWTLTLHDALNDTLASVTVANASLTNKSYNEFAFGSQIRVLVNATQTGQSTSYHFHLTSTVADGTVGCINSGDMTSADFLWFAYALVDTNNGLHPSWLFTGNGTPFLCIGNGNYLATYNFGNDANPTRGAGGQLVQHQLYFQPGEEVCGGTVNGQYSVIATEKRSADSSRNYQYGCLYVWDATTNAPNYSIKIPMGAPYGLHTENGITYMTINGSLYAWQCGSQVIIKVRKVAYEQTDYTNAVDNTFVYPNMMTSRYGVLMMGYPSITNNPNINFGVWSWGTVELTYPNSYGLSYKLANGQEQYTAANQLQMGCVYNFVDTMYISWSYIDANSVQHYGMDRLNNFSPPAPNFQLRSLIWDGGVTYKQKRGARLKIRMLPLPSGYTVNSFYNVDRNADIVSPYTAVAGDRTILQEATGRGAEFQWGFFGTTNGATLPAVFLDSSMQIDPEENEEDMRADEVNSITGTTNP